MVAAHMTYVFVIPRLFTGYVADVSGHGVGSGVVMGMFKSALRMRARAGGPIAPRCTAGRAARPSRAPSAARDGSRSRANQKAGPD